jgi:hypothetical protein
VAKAKAAAKAAAAKAAAAKAKAAKAKAAKAARGKAVGRASGSDATGGSLPSSLPCAPVTFLHGLLPGARPGNPLHPGLHRGVMNGGGVRAGEGATQRQLAAASRSASRVI